MDPQQPAETSPTAQSSPNRQSLQRLKKLWSKTPTPHKIRFLASVLILVGLPLGVITSQHLTNLGSKAFPLTPPVTPPGNSACVPDWQGVIYVEHVGRAGCTNLQAAINGIPEKGTSDQNFTIKLAYGTHDLAEAAGGDSIKILYKGNLTIEGQAIHQYPTTLDLNTFSGFEIDRSARITIKGIQFKGNTDRDVILANNSVNVTLDNLTFFDESKRSIAVNLSETVNITNSHFSGDDNSISISQSQNLVFERNVVKNSTVGMILYGVTGRLNHNLLANIKGAGLQIHSDSDLEIYQNTFSDIGTEPGRNWAAIQIYNNHQKPIVRVSITNNLITNNSRGIVLSNIPGATPNITISNNSFWNNGEDIFNLTLPNFSSTNQFFDPLYGNKVDYCVLPGSPSIVSGPEDIGVGRGCLPINAENRNPIEWKTDYLRVSADNFYMMLDGEKFESVNPSDANFYLSVQPQSPSNPNHQTLEVYWSENGQRDVRFVMGVAKTADQNGVYTWRPTHLLAYKGRFIEFKNNFNTNPLGSPVTAQNLVLDRNTDGNHLMVFEGLKIEAFDTPDLPVSDQGYKLEMLNMQDIVVRGYSSGSSYGANALLRRADESVVTDYSQLEYRWSSEDESVASVESRPSCTYGLSQPCPNSYVQIRGNANGTTRVIAQVINTSTNQIVATNHYNVTVRIDSSTSPIPAEPTPPIPTDSPVPTYSPEPTTLPAPSPSPEPTPEPLPQPDPILETGLNGFYFQGSNFETFVETRVDSLVDFDWGRDSGPYAELGSDNFSVRWSGTLIAPVTDTYRFYTNADDGTRLWIDGQLIVDDWNQHSARFRSGAINLEAGKAYPLVMDYFEAKGRAKAQLHWKFGNVGRQLVPSGYLSPKSQNVNFSSGLVGLEQGQTVAGTMYVHYLADPTQTRSVLFSIDGKQINLERAFPYYLGTDTNGKPYGFDTTTLSDGDHTLGVLITSRDGQKESRSFNFKVNNGAFSPIQSNYGEASNFVLINARTDEEIGRLHQGDTVNLWLIKEPINIRYDGAPDTAESVVFEYPKSGLDLSPRRQVESDAPYAIAGNDRNNYHYWNNVPLGEGLDITATSYSQNRGRGDSIKVDQLQLTILGKLPR